MKRLLAILLSVALFVTVGVGCTPAKKPAPPPAPTPTPTTPKVVPKPKAVTPLKKTVGMPTTSAEMHKVATKLSDEAAKAPGVKKAAVALSGTDAYVGLDLKPGVTGKKTDAVKKDVVNRVKKADKRLTNVYVSTDIDTVTRIKRVAQGIAQGKPLTGFTNELAEIGRRIVPSKAK